MRSSNGCEEADMITHEDILAIFGEQLDYIQNDNYREKVIRALLLGCERGGWASLEALEQMPFTLVANPHGITFIEHTIAVTEGAIGLAKAQIEAFSALPYAINMDRLIAGGLLHDVGKLVEIEPDGAGGYRRSRNGYCTRHPISGAIIAAEAGLDDETINTIACHAKEGEGAPKVIETILIHQADFATFDGLVALDQGKLII
jgi:putative nucleotidyltransferase with HDIG domain